MTIATHTVTAFITFLVFWITGWMLADFDLGKLGISILSWVAIYLWYQLAYYL